MMKAQTVNVGLRNYSRADCSESFNVELRRNTSKNSWTLNSGGNKLDTRFRFVSTLIGRSHHSGSIVETCFHFAFFYPF
jgi:hypothetical protein